MEPSGSHVPLPFWRGRARQSIAAATVGDVHLSDSHLNGVINSAALAAGLRQLYCPGTQPLRMSDYQWFDSKCAVLRSQLRHAKLLSPRSTEVRVMQRRYQGQLRCSKVAGNHRDMIPVSAAANQFSPILAPGQLATDHAAYRGLDACCMG